LLKVVVILIFFTYGQTAAGSQLTVLIEYAVNATLAHGLGVVNML
jgi:hypothetical protein